MIRELKADIAACTEEKSALITRSTASISSETSVFSKTGSRLTVAHVPKGASASSTSMELDVSPVKGGTPFETVNKPDAMTSSLLKESLFVSTQPLSETSTVQEVSQLNTADLRVSTSNVPAISKTTPSEIVSKHQESKISSSHFVQSGTFISTGHEQTKSPLESHAVDEALPLEASLRSVSSADSSSRRQVDNAVASTSTANKDASADTKLRSKIADLSSPPATESKSDVISAQEASENLELCSKSPVKSRDLDKISSYLLEADLSVKSEEETKGEVPTKSRILDDLPPSQTDGSVRNHVDDKPVDLNDHSQSNSIIQLPTSTELCKSISEADACSPNKLEGSDLSNVVITLDDSKRASTPIRSKSDPVVEVVKLPDDGAASNDDESIPSELSHATPSDAKNVVGDGKEPSPKPEAHSEPVDTEDVYSDEDFEDGEFPEEEELAKVNDSSAVPEAELQKYVCF